jgi:ABC-type glycerol-3-phosphate transport system substrate-binding protein
MTLDGSLLQMPFYMGTVATYSRNKWFDEAGIEPPTTENFYGTMKYLDTAEQLVNNSGAEFGLTFIRFDWQIWPWFYAEGVDIINDDGTEAAFNTETTHEILSRFRELTQNGVIPEVSWTGDWKPAAEQFGAANTAMYFGSGSALRLIQNYGSDWVSPDTMTLGGAPRGSRYGGNITMHGLGVTKPEIPKSQQKAAFDLISVITNKKWQKDFLRNTTVLVPHKEALSEMRNDEQFSNENPTLVQLYELWDKVSADVWIPPLVEASSEMAQTVDNQFSAAALGEKSVDQAIQSAEQQVNQALQG